MDTGSRILIVDQSEQEAALLRAELARAGVGYEVQHVCTPSALREALRLQDWDLVISDPAVPGADAGQLLRWLREARQEVPFILYAGSLEFGDGVKAMREGAQDFVLKSRPEHLLAVVERELARGRLRRDRDQAAHRVRHLASFDDLTGLSSQAHFLDRVAARLGPGAAHGAMIYIDIDRFRRINDSFGYRTGDALMRQFALRLRTFGGPDDLIARLGQDRFAHYTGAAATEEEAEALGTRLLRRLAPAFVQSGQEFFLTASLGVSLYPRHGTELAMLLRNAESAVSVAKKQGGNRVQVYRSELSDLASRNVQIEYALRHALERQELFLVYQPIVDLKTGAVVSAEALLRWRHPELGMVPPDQMVPIAEETGLISEIGEWVIRSACLQLRGWHQQGHRHLKVAVNVSPVQFRQADLAARVARVLEECALEPAFLEIEITESVAMHSARCTVETLTRLKELGVRVSIDDFGTGYSSLSYLKRFPIDSLKIDRSFVQETTAGSEGSTIVGAIISLGKALSLRVLAEGVETDEQLSYVMARGCQLVQGYYFSRPLDPVAFATLLEQGVQLPSRNMPLAA